MHMKIWNERKTQRPKHTQPTLTEGKNEIKCWFKEISLYTHWPISLPTDRFVASLRLYFFASSLRHLHSWLSWWVRKVSLSGYLALLNINIVLIVSWNTSCSTNFSNQNHLHLLQKSFHNELWLWYYIFIAILCELTYN